jgi:hypothetical protein
VTGSESEDDVVDVVATVGPLDPTVILLREFLHHSGAVRAVAVLDQAPGHGAALVDCARLAPVEVTVDDRTVLLPHAIELDADAPPCPDVKQLPRFEVRPQEGEIAAPPGGLEHYAAAVRDLADALGGRNVAMVTFETNDAAVPLSITARTGDPVVLSLGDEQFEMEAGWP